MIITISRQTGSLGEEITRSLAEKLDLPIITRVLAMEKWMSAIADKHELHMLSESPKYFLSPSALGMTYAEYLENKLQELAALQSIIVFGLGAQIIFANHPQATHVKIMASPEVRINRIINSQNMDLGTAKRFIDLTDRKHRRYIHTVYGKDWDDPALYDITINTNNLQIEDASSLLAHMVTNRQMGHSTSMTPTVNINEKPIVFMHPSEEEFASILDMYNITWEYEPRTFPLEWDVEGNIIQAFSPDFYLPNFDTYIELTTMQQKYVTEKNKKIRRLKKLYPDININIVYKKDFYTLAKRFGFKGE